MRKFNIILFFLSVAIITEAQFINNGATVTIQSGATLRIESDFQNNTTGTFTNNGTLEVSGDFTNAATATLTPSVGLIKFIGTANTDLDAGGDALNNVEIAKTGVSGTVTLATSTSLAGNLAFTGTGNNKIILGNFDLTMSNIAATVTATTDHPTNGWVITDKTGVNNGKFVKNIATGSSTKTLEIGDDTNYSPVSMVLNASSSGTVASRVLTNNLTPKYAETTDYISREWVVSTTNVTSNTLTGTYVTGDITGTQSLIKGATYHTGDWRFDGSAGVGNTLTASTTTADVRLSGMNFFGKANLKAFLQGAYSGGSMTTTLNSNNLIPLTSPYTDAAATVTSIPSGVTDWIKLELRDPANPGVSTSNKASAFIKSDGTIVGLDGVSYPHVKGGYSTSVVVLSHRNHLSIRTPDSGIDVVNPTLHNFTTGLSQAYDNPANSTNEAMKDISGVFVMWGGNGNSNTTVNYGAFGSDRIALLSNPNTPGLLTRGLGNVQTAIINNVYGNNDLNMNGTINYGAFGSDRIFLLSTVLGNDQTLILTQHL